MAAHTLMHLRDMTAACTLIELYKAEYLEQNVVTSDSENDQDMMNESSASDSGDNKVRSHSLKVVTPESQTEQKIYHQNNKRKRSDRKVLQSFDLSEQITSTPMAIVKFQGSFTIHVMGNKTDGFFFPVAEIWLAACEINRSVYVVSLTAALQLIIPSRSPTRVTWLVTFQARHTKQQFGSTKNATEEE